MVHAVPDILSRIVDHKRAALVQESSKRAEFEQRAIARTEFRDFRIALTSRQPAIIAEIKKASPSKGTLSESFHPERLAEAYSKGGAAALSVLTDREFFQGSLGDLGTARAAVEIPVLRKDFTIDDFHVIEAAAHGADAILLIAAVLNEASLRRFRELAAQFKMAAIVEVHDDTDLDVALASGAAIIGVNNRNLHTFEVNLRTSLELIAKIPAGIVSISESGIHSSADVQRLTAAGYQALLVGEHLMQSADPAAALRALLAS
ncbi:MAG: indole-3-glycerol phosphate synthase TrpC [Bryobacteraceae bacterium]|jgi:indole-3-glycerol phosphate synthase